MTSKGSSGTDGQWQKIGTGETTMTDGNGTWSVQKDGTVTFDPAKGVSGAVSQPALSTSPLERDAVTPAQTPVTFNPAEVTTPPFGQTIRSVTLPGGASQQQLSIGVVVVGKDNSATFTPKDSLTKGSAQIQFTVTMSDGSKQVVHSTLSIGSPSTVTVPWSSGDTVNQSGTGTTTTQDASHHGLSVTSVAEFSSPLLLASIAGTVWWKNRRRLDAGPYLARWDETIARLDHARDKWLSYERDIEKFLSAPMMRDMRAPEIQHTVESLNAAEGMQARGLTTKVKTEASLESQVVAFDECVTTFVDALAMAVFVSEQHARNGLDPHERASLERARDALAIALDGATSEGERRNALRAVESLVRQFGVKVPQAAKIKAIAAIESRTPVAQIGPSALPTSGRAGLGIITAETTLAMLDEAHDPVARRLVIETRIRRLGEREVDDLCDAIGVSLDDIAHLTPGASASWLLHADTVRIHDLSESVRAARSVVAGIAVRSTQADVVEAARSRMADLDQIIAVAEQATSTPMALHVSQ